MNVMANINYNELTKINKKIVSKIQNRGYLVTIVIYVQLPVPIAYPWPSGESCHIVKNAFKIYEITVRCPSELRTH